MKKKILGVLFVIILIITLIVLTGCGDNSKNNSSNSAKSLTSVVKIGDYVDYKTKVGESYTVSGDNIGITVNQTFETTGDEKWRVLSIENDGTINLISDKTVQTKNKQYYVFDGAKGYINYIEELNNICKIYGTGENSQSARSVTLEDIYGLIGWENIANYYGISTSDENIQESIYKVMNSRYGNEGSILNSKYTNKPSKNSQDTGYATTSEFDIKSDLKIETKSNMRMDTTQSNNLSVYNNDTLVKSLICPTSDNTSYYWIASTFEDYSKANNGAVNKDLSKVWGVYFISSDYKVYAKSIAFNETNISTKNIMTGILNYIRPVVQLKVDVEYKSGNGTESEPYILK